MSQERPLLARRLHPHLLIAFDALVAIGMTAAHISFLGIRDSAPSYTGPEWFGWLIAIVACLPVAVRRVWPMPALVLTVLGSAVATIVNAQREPWVPVACVLYIVALTSRKAVPALVATLVALVVSLGVNAITTPQPLWDGAVSMGAFVGVVVVGVWTSGRAIAARKDYAAQSARQLAHSAVNDERLRIARELHDVVAHSMSLIAVKAGIANHVADQRPEEARDALRVIESTSRGTLQEMRRLLGILRSETAELAPAPGLGGLPELVERARTAGVDVTMSCTVAGLPEAMEMSVYRIVQEALTNVVKHAGPVRCQVSVADGHGEVRIDVSDDGPGGTPGSGHGLIGMRERVMMYGGTFAAGPRPEGGFAVSARLPHAGEPA